LAARALVHPLEMTAAATNDFFKRFRRDVGLLLLIVLTSF
jgi:hypothetical protein